MLVGHYYNLSSLIQREFDRVTLSASVTKTAEFANSIDLDEVALVLGPLVFEISI